jgi:putative SOS response-associated peptidase YedK
MCGRYASFRQAQDLADIFDVALVDDAAARLPPSWNVAPTDAARVIVERIVDDGERAGRAWREMHVARWGLVPSWATDPAAGARMFNARVESVAEKPAFRRAFAARRCLLPADGFYEWYTPEGPTDSPRGKGKKQPFFLHRADGGLLVMAGLYEIWRDPTRDRADDDAWLRTCTVITTQATDAAGHIHDRMPMVVTPEAVDAWLDPTVTDPDRVLELLAVTDADALEAYAVSTRVNRVQNNDPSLLEPLAESDGDGGEPDTLV